MATYAIGDLHGNFDALQRLLARIDFDASRDHVWFVGDLVNRGPDSLGCLRFIRDLGDSAITILGNHDLALLVKAQKPGAAQHINRSVAPILNAPDGDQLLDWLRARPVLHIDDELGWIMVHAGIPREWDLAQAGRCAAELESALRGPHHAELLAHLYGNAPDYWADTLAGFPRLRYITNALTRQRFVHPDGRLDMTHKTTLAATPAPLAPWFSLPNRKTAQHRIVFGHWSALTPLTWPEYNVWCIDSGAAWGGRLMALRLDGREPETIAVAA